MQIVSAHDVAVSFVTDELFRDVAFRVEERAHIGLVGINGSGKTTLLRLITGEMEPSSGQITRSRECCLAYMEQFLAADEAESLYEAVLHVFDPLLALEARLAEVNRLLEHKAERSLLSEQGQLNETYADQGGYTFRTRLRACLLGLGFTEEDLQLPVAALSGGQRSKAALAKVLLADANLILLDEPTNHLDIESIQWLEGFLANYRGAFIVVSHDRYFLDQVTTEIWDLHHSRLACYRGNYSVHLEKRLAEEEQVKRQYSNQMREIRRVEAIVEQQKRFNQARNYITIASKEKQIARLKEELAQPDAAERSLRFSFNVPPPGGNDVLEIYQAAKAFGPKCLFEKANLQIRKGERVFLLGPNGCGKSTLMKMVAGQLAPDAGEVRLGINIYPTYYDQLHGHIAGNETILQYFTDAYPRLTQRHIRTMLGSFLFSGDAVEKTLSTLSGGEKARLELMKLLLAPANLLLLDEPTNHLDIASCEAVEQALLAYPGSMLVVSHDRYLVNKLADRCYYMTETELIESLGNYDDLLQCLAAAENKKSADTEAAAETQAGEQSFRARKEAQAAERRRQKQLLETASAIARLEAELALLEQTMAEAAADYQQLMALQAKKDAAEESYLAALEKQESLQGEGGANG